MTRSLFDVLGTFALQLFDRRECPRNASAPSALGSASDNAPRQVRRVNLGVLFCGALVFCAGAMLHTRPAQAATGSGKFIPTFLVYYGGGPTLTSADAGQLA